MSSGASTLRSSPLMRSVVAIADDPSEASFGSLCAVIQTDPMPGPPAEVARDRLTAAAGSDNTLGMESLDRGYAWDNKQRERMRNDEWRLRLRRSKQAAPLELEMSLGKR